MKKRTVAVLLLGVALVATGCGSSEKSTEATTTEAATTEAATTEAATEEETTEAATEVASEEETTEAATTEAASEEETTEAATTEAASEEETTEAATTEAASEKETTEAATTEAASEEETTEEATTEAATEEETTEEATTEATTEEETTEEATTEAATEEETAEAATTEAATEEETTEVATTEAASEEETTEEATTEAASEEETTEAATTEAASEEETTEAASEEGTEEESETEYVRKYSDMPEYTALDYVTLGDYKGLEIEVEPIEVTEEDIQSYIDMDTVETLTEGTVEEGDTVNIDYEGKLDGEAFDGGTAEGQSLEIGSDTFIDGFEDGLIGVAVGDTVDLNLTFPEDYYSEELAGQEVVFTVTVNSIDRVPELTDEVAAEVSDGEYATAEEYKEGIRQELAESDEETKETLAKSDLVSQAYANATIDSYPQDNLDYIIDYAMDYYQQMAGYYGMTLKEFEEANGASEEEFQAQLEEIAKESLAQEMVLKAIAETEGMEISDEEYQEGLETYAEMVGMEAADFEAEYGEHYLRNSLLQEKVLDFLYENAVITETTEAESDTEAATESATEAESASEDASEAETTEAVTEAATTEAASEAETTETATEAESSSEAES